MKFLFYPIAILMLSGCQQAATKVDVSDSSKWIDASIQKIRPFDHGWYLSGFTGGSAVEGSWYKFSLTPQGKSTEQTISEFRSLLKQQLSKDGFVIKGEGNGRSSVGDTSYSLRVESPFYMGSIMFLFQSSKETISGIMAIAQVPRFKTEQDAAANP